MEHELHQPLAPLLEALPRLDVEPAEQVDDEEQREEAEHDPGRPGDARVTHRHTVGSERDEEEGRQHVGERDVARDRPVHLRPRDREERGEEERAREARLPGRLRPRQRRPPAGGAVPARGHANTRRAAQRRLSRSSATSSARAARPRRSRSSSPSRRRLQGARDEPCVELRQRAAQSGDVVRCGHDAGARLADQLRRGAVGRHGGEDRPLGGQVLEDLPREDAAAAAARLGDQQEQRLRVALQLERAPARDERVQLEAVAELEALRPLAVGAAEVADEARDHVEARTRRAR